MSVRLRARSRILFRFSLSHRILSFTIVAMLVLAGIGITRSSAVKQTLSVFAGSSELAASAKTPARTIAVHAAGRGKPHLNLQEGRGMKVDYQGNSELAAALRNGAARPRALASADFDHNGTPDVVVGYELNGVGVVTLQRGNPDAFAPADDSVFARLQQGYNPESLLPGTDVYAVPVAADFVETGNFDNDSDQDVLVAAKGGALYVLGGDGRGGLGAPTEIELPGAVTALAAGEFRAADGFTDVAVSVNGPGGYVLLIFDNASKGFVDAVVQQPLSEPANAIEFGGLDDDPYMDVSVAAGSQILIVHGWGRKENVSAQSRVERVNVGSGLRGLAVGEFAWDREGRSEIGALAADGTVHIVQHAKLDTRPFTDAEAATRTRGQLQSTGVVHQDVESVPSWRPGRGSGWSAGKKFSATSFQGASSASAKPLLRTNLSFRETDDLLLMGESQPRIEIVRPMGPSDKSLADVSTTSLSVEDDLARTTLDVESAPVAVLTLPKKLNGVQDVLVLGSTSIEPTIVMNAANTTITVDRTDDPSGAGLTAASACTGAANDCSLRGALQFANNPANNNTTISIPSGTYVLSINGGSAVGCDGNATGDLAANQTMTILGAGAGSTIIRQTGTGPANDGDRVMCMNEPFTLNLVYNFSGVTFVGGREGTAAGTGTVIGGGGIIGGEKGNVLTLTDVVLANNQVTVLGSGNLGGGGLQWTGGDLNITNCTIGGSSAPGTYADRTSTTTANLQAGSGGGVTFTPSAPQHTASTGVLTVTGSTFSRNTAASLNAGGGGADLLIFAFAAPGGIGTGSATFGGNTVFSNNQALGTANGGGIIVESLGTTVTSGSFNNNSAGNRGGGIYVAGASLHLNGTSAITFSGNTATNGGSSVSTAAATSVSGTNTTIGGDIEVTTGGSWTNNAGSTLAPTNVVIAGGTFTMNNSTMNVGGNLSIAPGAVVGATFNGNTGTVNIAGNFSFTAGGSGPATTFNAGTSTFNFNGTGAQSISNATSITFNNLTDANVTQPLTLNNSLAVNGTLNVNGLTATLSPAAAAVVSGTGTLTGTGTARVTRIAATADFLTQYSITNKTLTNLTIDYNGAGNQTVNNAPAYSNLVISGSGTKTLQGNAAITGNLTIAAATFAGSTFNFSLAGNWTNNATFTPGTGTVTFAGTSGTQSITGNTTFFNLTLNNAGATTNFGATTTTIDNDLVASAGTMDGGTSTIIFTGVTDNAGAISGASPKLFHNLQINSPATISNSAGGNITIEGNYTNSGTFNQNAALTTIFSTDNNGDGAHSLSGSGATTFGNFTINGANTVDAGSHNFNVVGTVFTVNGTFTGNASTVSFNGAGGQGIAGDGAKNFSGLLITNPISVNVINGTGAVDASVSGLLTLNTDLSVATGAILQQSGMSTGAADVLGTVRRTDLGAIERSFGNVNNTVTINSGTPPTQLDFNLVKTTPSGFPVSVKVVPRTYTLTPTGGAGISATLKLRYIDPAELVGITESRLALWKDLTGSDAWTPQGGTVDAAGNFVSHSGISSFSEWAIAEASDLTLSKANNVSGSAVVGQPWNWTLTATNAGSPATFTAGQTILTDNLPNSNLNYGTPTVQNVSNITGSANISCSIVSNDLTCTASGGSVTFDSNLGASSFEVVFSATPQAAASYQNPRTGGGIAQIDPNNVIVESNETNNSSANNTVTVGKANTTTTITSDNPDPSVVGQPVTVHWNVSVNAPGSLGAPLTGNVTVSDGTNTCVAAVSAGQCDITFTSAGAKSLTATYAGDSNYNGSASSPVTAHTVNKADTTTTITSDNPDPSSPGDSVTVQWTVTVNAPGSGTPTGNVTVTVSGGAETCSAAVSAGQCSLTLNTGGTRTITATYAGDSNFNTSSDTEEHQVCTSSLVTTNADNGAGSLRQTIADACDGATVTFDTFGSFSTPQTVTLTSGEIVIDKNLTIDARGAQVSVSGNNASRVFTINANKIVGIVGLTISNGQTAGTGGGVLNNGTLTIINSTLTANNAGTDGGAISTSASATSLTLINTTISGNNASEDGGGIVVLGGTATSINSTFTNNRADSDDNASGSGGGIAAISGTTTLKNTIVGGNLNEDGATDAADNISGTVDAASSFNLIGTGGAGGLTNGVNNNQVGVSAGLGPLGNNGGTTQTHALLTTSSAVEAGSNANLPADSFDLDGDANTGESLPVDQRGVGFPRSADSQDVDAVQTVDIGAFELHPSIEDIADKSVAEDNVLNFSFNLADGTGTLISSVTGMSSNTTLLPNANISITGSGSTRNVQITPATNANTPANGAATITVTVTATNGQTAVDTFVLTVTESNDNSVAGDDTLPAIDEDSGTRTIPFTDLVGNDTAGPANESGQTLTVTNVSNPVGGTVVINGTNVDFTPAANFFGTASFDYTVTDNGTTNGVLDAKSDTGSVSFTINPINDPPSFTIAADPPASAEDGGPQTVPNFATSISAGPNEVGQTLTFNISPTGSTGTLTFSSGPAIDATTGTLTYTATGNTNGTATFSVTLSDNGSNTPPNSNTSAAQTFTITVGEQNDGPVVTTTAGNLAYTENNPATAIDPGVTVTDADSTNLASASVAITTGFVSGQDTLGFANQLGITGNYNSGTGVLTLTGTTTVANYQTALRSVTYQNSSDNPTLSRTVTFSVNDGFTTASATRGITITAVNDAPVNTVPGPQGTNQNTPLTFSSGNGNQISVADADAGTADIRVTLSATNGTLTLATSAGLTFSAGDGTADATMTFDGTLSEVNGAMNGMSFNPNAGFSGAATVTITSDDLGNSGSGGPLSDIDVVNIQVATNISIEDASSPEPTSGSADMIFTVTLSAPAPAGGASVSFATQDQPPAISHAVAGQDYTATSGIVNFAAGEQFKTVTVPILSDNKINETNETFLIVLGNPVNATIADGTATGTILIANPAGAILIGELRTSGPAGAGDDFVEIYNNSNSPHTVAASDGSGGYGLFKMGASCSNAPVLIGVIPNGTVLPGRGHYLFVGSAYSLGAYGAGDQTMMSDIENDRNVGIFSTANAGGVSSARRLDAVGFGANTGGTCDLLREGATLTPLVGSVLEYSYFRDECGKKGNPSQFGPCPTGGATKDSDDNAADLVFVETTGAVTVAGQRLGAPGPQGLTSPRKHDDIFTLLLDATRGASGQPNRERDPVSVPNGANGTLTIRRRFVNATGGPVTQLRFRIVDISALTTGGVNADLRAITSGSIVISNIQDSATCLASTGSSAIPCSVTVHGTMIEQPPNQPLGGALNSSLNAGVINLAAPLANGASINLQFLLGVEKTGAFKFYFNIEALP